MYESPLAEKCSLHVGFSAAANVCASVKFVEKNNFDASTNVVTILCDTGLKY